MDDARAKFEAETDIVSVVRKLRLHSMALQQLLPEKELEKLKQRSEFKAIGGKEKSTRAEKYTKEDSGAIETYSHSNERKRIEKMIS